MARQRKILAGRKALESKIDIMDRRAGEIILKTNYIVDEFDDGLEKSFFAPKFVSAFPDS